jgi:hypothetical protein
LDKSVLDFLQFYKQNGILIYVNLLLQFELPNAKLLMPILTHLLPLFNNTNSLQSLNISELGRLCDGGNSKEYSQMITTLLALPQLLETR